MADEKLMRVAASPKLAEGEVALWEKDEDHPDGEIFIANNPGKDGKPVVHEVAETPGVMDAMNKGRLVRAGSGRRTELDAGEIADGPATGNVMTPTPSPRTPGNR